jgi:hypothetical protein
MRLDWAVALLVLALFAVSGAGEGGRGGNLRRWRGRHLLEIGEEPGESRVPNASRARASLPSESSDAHHIPDVPWGLAEDDPRVQHWRRTWRAAFERACAHHLASAREPR